MHFSLSCISKPVGTVNTVRDGSKIDPIPFILCVTRIQYLLYVPAISVVQFHYRKLVNTSMTTFFVPAFAKLHQIRSGISLKQTCVHCVVVRPV